MKQKQMQPNVQVIMECQDTKTRIPITVDREVNFEELLSLLSKEYHSISKESEGKV